MQQARSPQKRFDQNYSAEPSTQLKVHMVQQENLTNEGSPIIICSIWICEIDYQYSDNNMVCAWNVP